jgi:hypothetical protein
MLGIIWEEKKKKKNLGWEIWKQIMTMQSRKCILIRKKKKKKKNLKSKIKNKIKKKKIKIEYAPM